MSDIYNAATAMHLLDRYIIRRILTNFVLLFLLLFLFASAIDLVLNLDEFVRLSHERDPERGALGQALGVIWLGISFEAPRLFLFYGYLHGIVAIGAMGFTLAQMHRHRELVAVLASGVSLTRLAMPFLVAVFGISVLQLLNQELMLHRVAPLVLRGHGDAGLRGADKFEVPFVEDARGTLLQAPEFDPFDKRLRFPTFLQRDDQGRTVQRITADEAVWDAGQRGWTLVNGLIMSMSGPGAATTATISEPLSFFATDLDPNALIVRRHADYAGMLSLGQIEQMLDSGRVLDTARLLRHRYARFAAVAVNLLVLLIALPSFLLREPASLMRQAVVCATMALPALTGSAIGMMVEMPGIPPAVGVFLPVIVLIPVAAARWTFLKT